MSEIPISQPILAPYSARKVNLMSIIGKFKEMAGAINTGKKIFEEIGQIRDAVANHNSDQAFKVAKTEEEYKNMLTQKQQVIFLPGPEQKDIIQIKAYTVAAWKLSVNLVQAAAAKLKD